jgi:hypothetical protein
MFDARQWYRSRQVILGFLSSILFQTTAVVLVLTDVRSEWKRQIADVSFQFLVVLLPVLLFCSWQARKRNSSLQCCSLLRATAKLQFRDGSEPVVGIMLAWAYSSPCGIW